MCCAVAPGRASRSWSRRLPGTTPSGTCATRSRGWPSAACRWWCSASARAARAVSRRRSLARRPLLEQLQEIAAVAGLPHASGRATDVVGADVAHAQRDLLEASHLQPLSLLDGLDEVRRLRQRLVGAGVGPGEAAAELLDTQLAQLEVVQVHVSDLELAACRRTERGRDVDHSPVVEVEAGDRERRPGLRRLLLERHGATRGIELDDAVSFGIAHVVGEHRGATLAARRTAQALGKAVAVVDVVAERQRDRVAGDELAADEEGLRESVGARLDRPRDRQAERLAGAEEPAERLLIVRRGDDEDVADPRQHEGRQRVIDHRLVVDRQQLLAHAERERVQPPAGAAGEDDPLHLTGALVSTVLVRRKLAGPASTTARRKTASSMGRLSFPVNVFCWLGW